MKVLAVDQALFRTGAAIMDDRGAFRTLVISPPDRCRSDAARCAWITESVTDLCRCESPDLVVMEHYGTSNGHAVANSLRSAELGGAIKVGLFAVGFVPGWGTARNSDGRDEIRENLDGFWKGERRLFACQSKMSMNMYMFGRGNVSKDTGYLLAVRNVVDMDFKTDDEADAYMHACMALDVMVSIRNGRIGVTDRRKVLAMAGLFRNDANLSKSATDKMTEAEVVPLMRGQWQSLDKGRKSRKGRKQGNTDE